MSPRTQLPDEEFATVELL
eukprot:gene4887-biopygen4410